MKTTEKQEELEALQHWLVDVVYIEEKFSIEELENLFEDHPEVLDEIEML